MTATDVTAGEITITQRLLDSAAVRDARAALSGGSAPSPYSYPELAAIVQRAAAGLAWRGVRPRDTVGVYVADAAAYVIACHAIRAAGGIPSPVSADLTVAEVASQLADCGARMLITSPPAAAAALAAADRSWVRQVISFGEAPGAMPFASLLGLGSLRPHPARPHDLALLPYVRCGEGSLSPAGLTHLDLAAGLAAVSAAASVTSRDVVVAAPPAGDGREYTTLLDHVLARGATVVAAPAGELAAAVREHQATAVITTRRAEVPENRSLRILAVSG